MGGCACEVLVVLACPPATDVSCCPSCCSLPQFGGSSVASAERMREVADIVCSFPEHLPVVVLSAMGKVGRQRAAPPGNDCSSSI